MSAVVALLAGLTGAAPRQAHPQHTTLTTIDWQPGRQTLQIAVRVFTQDLRDALSRSPIPWDAVVCRYASIALVVRDASGRRVEAARCTVQGTADVTWIRLEHATASVAGASVLCAFLFEAFTDQVNVVQTRLAGGARSRTMVFTRGDGPKPIDA